MIKPKAPPLSERYTIELTKDHLDLIERRVAWIAQKLYHGVGKFGKPYTLPDALIDAYIQGFHDAVECAKD